MTDQFPKGGRRFVESIQGPHPASASGTVWIASPDLFLGWAAATRSIHRCLADRLTWCYACDMYHDPDDADACPHILGQTAAPADRVSFPSGTNGTAVVVHGDNAGYVTLTVHITSYAGPPPICEAKVVPETVVPVHAFIICSASGTPATTTNRVVLMDMPLFKRPFRIRKGKQYGSYHPSSAQVKQKCKQRRLVAHISGKKVKEWHKESTDTWQKAPQFYVRNATSLAPRKTLSHCGPSVKHRCIANSGDTNTVAHELGHAQGLPDIYVSRPSITNVVTGVASRTRIPADWGSPSEEGYYPSGIQQSAIVLRLLMYGVGSPTKRDIPLGNVYGLWYPGSYLQPVQQSSVPLGFSPMLFRIPSATDPCELQ